MRLQRYCIAGFLFNWLAFVFWTVVPIRAVGFNASSTELALRYQPGVRERVKHLLQSARFLAARQVRWCPRGGLGRGNDPCSPGGRDAGRSVPRSADALLAGGRGDARRHRGRGDRLPGKVRQLIESVAAEVSFAGSARRWGPILEASVLTAKSAKKSLGNLLGIGLLGVLCVLAVTSYGRVILGLRAKPAL